MENQPEWVTYIQLFATLVALFLAVFMPSIQKAADRRDSHLAIIKIFRLSVEEVNIHLSAMEKSFRNRLTEDQRSREIPHIAIVKVIEEIEYFIKSQTKVMNSVIATDLPHPTMATMAAMFERDVAFMCASVVEEAEKNPFIDPILRVYLEEKDHINMTAKSVLLNLEKIEKEVGPHPILQSFSFFLKIPILVKKILKSIKSLS